MTPRKDKITAKDIASRNPSPAARRALDRALKHAYEAQQKILDEAAKIK